nr:MAG TPA: hypothetical protein [Caudoviricetes sp.]
MRKLQLDDNWGTWKFGDTDAVMTFTPTTDDKKPNFTNNVLTFKIAQSINRSNGDYIASAPGHVSSNNNDVELYTSDLAQLEPGTYAVELWITDGITRKNAVYPSDGYCFFTIDKNTMAVTDISNISTKTLEAVYADLLQKINNFKQGAAGKDGKTPKIVAGTVTKLSSDAQPTFLLTPTADDPNTYQIDLGLPAGPKGDKGDSVQGPQGVPGEDGTTPHIDKATGDWFVGSLDTQVKAQGPEAPLPDMSKYVTVDSLNQELTTMNDAIKKRPTIDALQAVSDQNGKTLAKLNSLIDSLNASKEPSQSASASISASTSASQSASSASQSASGASQSASGAPQSANTPSSQPTSASQPMK